ncbi:MAG TPA: glycosyltransferase family 39 protein [Elusimicrobiota bacterium]|nr:glycosyltransferase family 39 protein [Elusimicrobiota bacterium]
MPSPPISSRTLNLRTPLLLSALIAFYAIQHIVWLRHFGARAPGEDLGQIELMIPHYSALLDGRWGDFMALLRENYSYSPLYYLGSIVSVFLFGKSIVSLLLPNLLYFSLAVVFIQFLGERFQNKTLGLWSAALFSLTPAVYLYSRSYCLEFGTMGLLPLTLWLLLKSEGFSRPLPCIGFGMAAAAASLMKDTHIALAFIAGPLLYVLYLAWKKIFVGNKRVLFNIFLAAAVFVGLLAPRYWNLDALRWRDPMEEIAGWVDVSVMTWGFIHRQLSWPLFLLFIVGGLALLKNRNREPLFVILPWILVPWTILTFMPHWKLTRHAIPYLPAVALAMGYGLLSIGNRMVRDILGTAILLVAAVQFYQFSSPIPPKNRLVSKNFVIDNKVVSMSEHRWKRNPIAVLEMVDRLKPAGGKLLIASRSHALWGLSTWLYAPRHWTISFIKTGKPPWDMRPNERWLSNFKTCDFLVTSESWDLAHHDLVAKWVQDLQSTNYPWETSLQREETEFWRQYRDVRKTLRFQEIAVFLDEELPDFSVRLYARQ